MDFKNLNIAEFIRYILTGFNFTLFIIILPTIFLQPSFMKDLILKSSFLSISLLSIAVGFLLDILKVYQLTPKFKTTKTQFMDKIADILEVPKEQASSYFSLTSKLSKKYGFYDLERRRSEWVLTMHTAFTLIISIFVWSFVIIIEGYRHSLSLKLGIPIFAIVLSCFIALRLLKIANREREKSDQDFFVLLTNNKTHILNGWKLKVDNTYEDKKDGAGNIETN